MKNWRRTVVWFAGSLLVAAVCGAIAFHTLVDPERLKRVAREKAAQAWSRDLAMGEVSLSLFPWPSLAAREVALANPAWAKSRNLVQVESLTARLELLPLLVGKVRIASLDLDGVKGTLEVAPDGHGSWEMIPGGAVDSKKRGDASDTEFLAFRALRIRNADIVYRPKSGAPVSWRVEDAAADSDRGLRNVRLQASLSRKRHRLAVTAQIEDLSRVGHPGATTGAKVDLDWGKTQLAIAGTLPLEGALKGAAVKADLNSTSLDDVLGFFDVKQGRTAAASAHLEVRESQGAAEIARFAATLGKLSVSGDAKVARSGAKTTVNGKLEGDRLVWERFLLDAGFPPVPGKEPDELFLDVPLAWPILVSLQGTQGAFDVKLKSVVLRNHVELTNWKSSVVFDGDRLDLKPLSTETLGGSASGTMSFEGRKKLVRASLDGDHLLLERWFRERGAAIPFAGGPMKIKAVFTATGDSMKDLAATLTGPVSIRMGSGVWSSEKAGHAESVMTSAFAASETGTIDFECVGASFLFSNGRATSKAILGARSTASQLLTSGFVDLREESLGLRGRVQPKSGKVGLATIAGDIQITGKIRHPRASLDPVGTPAAIVRGAAAIATAGLSLVGTAMADAEQAKKNDACEAVFTMR